ncbi:cellulose binding domain-containing protein [Micromonosporaceae bacterium Da 78-11]
MPAKHAARRFAPARLVFGLAAAILVILVGWAAVRAVGPAEAGRQPVVVLPSMPQVPLEPATTSPAPSPSPSPSPSASPSHSPSLSPSPSKSPSARPSRSRSSSPPSSPSARATTTPTPRDVLAAAISVSAGWNSGYVATVRVENTGSTPQDWSVTVNHDDEDGLRLGTTWGGAGGRQQGSDLIFSGGPLEAGGSITFGYQAAKSARDRARPAGCTMVGGTCAVR